MALGLYSVIKFYHLPSIPVTFHSNSRKNKDYRTTGTHWNIGNYRTAGNFSTATIS